MRLIRAIALVGFVSLAVLFMAAPASAQQTTTTLPGALPVTGAPDTGGEVAAPTTPEGALARTGIELIPVVNAAIAMIFAGAVLLVALEVQRSGRRERSLWTY